MANIYNSASATFPSPIGTLVGEQEFNDALARTDDYQLKCQIWHAWYNASGIPLRQHFTSRLHMLNKGARANGWSDAGYFEWYTDMHDAQFNSKVLHLLHQVMPLYKQLHAYVRHKLFNSASPSASASASASANANANADAAAPIPIPMLGNLWAQTWSATAKTVMPYPEFPHADPTDALRKQAYTPRRMFRTAEAFFVSLGLPKMTRTFWQKSHIHRPAATAADTATATANATANANATATVTTTTTNSTTTSNSTKGGAHSGLTDCHASAWDLAIGDDYRIMMCTEVNAQHFRTVHHEMGHVHYYMAYRSLPTVYRGGAHSGFHEAIGDTIALSVMTPEHLHKLALLDQPPTARQFDINFLMTAALDRLPLLPFALAVDVWRWRAFNGSIGQADYNKAWWQLRTQYGGVAPPSLTSHDGDRDRESELYLDAGAKYHVALNVPYIRYFMSFLLQFQFYQAMCDAAGYTGALHRCDFYGSVAAGSKLRKMMELGNSKPWQDALQLMTGTREMSAGAILLYFKPLHEWLIDYNCKNRVVVGWGEDAKAQC